MSNEYNNVLYFGVTSRLNWRVAEHKLHINPGFTAKYNCEKLVYYELHQTIVQAIAREKQLKNWKREWKDALVYEQNPDWKDLAGSVGVDDALLLAVKEYYQTR